MKARIPKGMGGGGNMNAMLQQAQKMQEKMVQLQEELDAREFEVTAGGGMVTVKMTGKKQLLNLELKPDIVDPDDIEMLQDIIVAAINEAVRTIDETVENEMGEITGGMGMPGMPNLF